MAATIFQNLPMDQGADFFAQWTWSTNNVLVDLTGATARCMLRTSVTDPVVQLSLTTTITSSGSITLGGTSGTILLYVSKAATAALIPAGSYDLFLDYPAIPPAVVGLSQKFVAGGFTVAPSDTR